MKKKIIEILENHADWANTYGSDVVFSGKFEDVAEDIEKLINEDGQSEKDM